MFKFFFGTVFEMWYVFYTSGASQFILATFQVPGIHMG